ncbi:hypothetical protein [Mariprofundus ferrooxydans]|uniref:hypothetical protein n=1 Tax=Mariprofundus ferrooxydans TaxID=314344 RepID=UPI0014318CC9|nr:hypothetical protein [Mariprofundus ferrooxydans]
MVKKASSESIGKMLDIFGQFAASEDGAVKDPYEPTVLSFSDSIIRIRNLQSEENLAFPVGHLFYELNDLLHIQMNLINHDVLVRGGIALGDVNASSNTRIYGPAFITAYDLESKFANYPRIIVSPDLINAVGTDVSIINENHSAEEERDYLRKLLAVGDDGLCFIDYLRAAESEFDNIESYPLFLEKHKSLILKEGMAHKELSNVSSKYVWLATYHNRVIKELSDTFFDHYEMKREDLLISNSEITVISNL